ncbi:MAG: betaine-aldehyde dehydrogenase [Leptospiraceae bacterium]|nr:betaine-aldehyde dehydrogenase [Leptospiraceae bacterium]
MKVFGSFVGNQEIQSGREQILLDPSTGEASSKVVFADEETILSALEEAGKAQKIWKEFSPAKKSSLLKNLAVLLRQKNDDLARLDVEQVGKPWKEAAGYDIESGVEAIEFFASASALKRGESYRLGSVTALVDHEPYGIVFGIGAWNYPFQIAAWKLAPALAAGNAMIFKPSELTPGSALELAKLCVEAGLPEGLFQVIQGDGLIAERLVKDPLIRKVSLTGSVPTGKKVMQSASTSIKPVTLELGGKGPLVVFEDSHIPSAVAASMLANFYTQGEICSNGTRVFVQSSVYEEFLNLLMERTQKINIGDPKDSSTDMGPLISDAQYRKVLGYIEKGISEGAELKYGGRFPESLKGTKFEKGYYVEPTIFSRCRDEMTIVREEIFGPVLSLLSFETEEEVIQRSNNTGYGLAGAVFTKDINRALRFSRNLEVGVCWINNYNVTPVELPFGGVKFSGIGRENAIEAMYGYTQAKTIYIESGNLEFPY